MMLVPGALPREGAHHEAGRLAVEVLGVVAASVLPEPSHRFRGLIGDRGAGKDTECVSIPRPTRGWGGRPGPRAAARRASA